MIPVLLLEDEPRVAGFVRRGLEAEGYRVTLVDNGHDAIEHGLSGVYELIILDAMVPGPSGFDVCRELRRSGMSTPIMMLTARDSTEDIVEGLGDGADDYLTKPFPFEVLVARLKALHRRRTVPIAQGAQEVLTVGALTIDLPARVARLDGVEVELTKTEFNLLALLAARPGAVHSRERILSGAWGVDRDPMTNVVDVYIRRLRQKLPGIRIEAMRGAGYKLLAET
jgi:DNA-binding response OmpR family regulator